MISHIGTAWATVHAFDADYQKDGENEARAALFKDGIWTQIGYNLQPPHFVDGPEMAEGNIDEMMEKTSHLDYRMKINIVRADEISKTEKSENQDAEHE